MRLHHRLTGARDRVRSTRTGRIVLQTTVAVIGTTVVVVGAVLIPLPGPGWLIVLTGLAILAAEFAWARRLLAFARARLEAWWRWVGRQHILTRALIGLVGLLFVGSVAYLSLHLSFGVTTPSDFVDLVRLR
jgi:uncharacterized protein (TIGR02611 family)